MFGFISKNPRRAKSSTVIFDAAALAWFAYASITNPSEKIAFNNFVLTAKAQGWWSSLIYMNYCSPTGSGAGLMDCVGLTTGVKVGTPVYAANGGWGFDISQTQSIKTGVLPNLLALPANSAGLYIWTQGYGVQGCIFGSRSSSTSEFSIFSASIA